MKDRLAFVARCFVVLVMVMGVVGSWAVARTPDAFAGDSDKKEAKDNAKKNENGRTNGDGNSRSKANNNVGDGEGSRDDNDEEHDNRGQVIEILADVNPQQIIITNEDGRVTVMLMKTKLLETSGVGIGDHIRVVGEKVHEQLFEATEVNIRTRCCGEPVSDNDDDSDNNDDPANPDEDNENR